MIDVASDRVGPSSSGPAPAASRITELDALRGIALLGVIWMNLFELMSDTMPPAVAAGLPTAGIDRYVSIVNEWLVLGKAQFIFATLFGVGFAIFAERARSAGRDSAFFYARRLLGLFILGIGNLFFFFGDFLHIYAVTAVLALAVVAVAPGIILPLGVALFLCSDSLPSSTWLLGDAAVEASRAAMAQMTDRIVAAISSGRIEDLHLASVAYHDVFTFSLRGVSNYGTYLGQFLIGFWLVRSGVLIKALSRPGILVRLATILIPLGLLLSAFKVGVDLASIEVPRAVRPILASGTILVLATGYAAGILAMARVDGRATRLASAYGRMALTNYLAQTAVIVVLVTDVGLGGIHYLGATALLVIAFGVAAVQAIASRYWLCRHHYGPVEWLWRCFTYAQLLPLRLDPQDAVVRNGG